MTHQHWLLCMPEDNFDICVRHGLLGFGMNKAKLANDIKPGDLVTFYITRKSVDPKSERVQALRGVAKVAEPAYMDDKELWNAVGGDIFPYRVPVKFLDSRSQVPFRPLIGRFSFIDNDLYWALPMKKGYVKLTNADWQVVERALKAHQTTG